MIAALQFVAVASSGERDERPQRGAALLDGVVIVGIGPVADQAALHGLLQRVRDLGMPLVSVTRIEPEALTTGDQPR